MHRKGQEWRVLFGKKRGRFDSRRIRASGRRWGKTRGGIIFLFERRWESVCNKERMKVKQKELTTTKTTRISVTDKKKNLNKDKERFSAWSAPRGNKHWGGSSYLSSSWRCTWRRHRLPRRGGGGGRRGGIKSSSLFSSTGTFRKHNTVVVTT